ncbi:MAG: MBL fold metallo-hydrolase [Thermoguttaceae bacterium]|nr:MBL fold metallo-hydrolase [Thermoguttaceae bacterium]
MPETLNAPFSWSNSMGDFTLLNGRGGDNALKTVFRQSGEITLFDLGDLRNMTCGELLEVRQVLISHGHFDHVFGFDALLRASFPLKRPILFSGPAGLA